VSAAGLTLTAPGASKLHSHRTLAALTAALLTCLHQLLRTCGPDHRGAARRQHRTARPHLMTRCLNPVMPLAGADGNCQPRRRRPRLHPPLHPALHRHEVHADAVDVAAQEHLQDAPLALDLNLAAPAHKPVVRRRREHVRRLCLRRDMAWCHVGPSPS